MIIWTLIPGIVYLFVWYLPNFSLYNHMMVYQSGTFSVSSESFNLIEFNLREFFLNGPSIYLTILFPIMLFVSILIYRRGPAKNFRILFPAALAWNLLEMHKLLMVYLPTRYQLSLLFSLGFTISIVLAEIFKGNFIKQENLRNLIRYSVIIIGLAVFVLQLSSYQSTLADRTFNIREANRYLAENSCKDDIVIGAWAPTLTWKSSSRAFPVWDGFLNYEDPLNSFHPRAIVSEPDEEDSNQAYLNQGIYLDSVSDSVRTFNIGLWDVNIYWIKEPHH
jgi:hypothetical protein